MSIEQITERIIAEAKEEADQLLAKADRERQAVLEKAGHQAEALRKEAAEKAKEDAKLVLERKVSVAELEARKLRLGAKQCAIVKSFDLALEKLASQDESSYIGLLVKSIKETGVSGGELLLNGRDRETIGKKVVDLVNGAGQSALSLSTNTIDAKGGFVLRKGSVEINATLETMVNAIREEATPDVVTILF